MGDSSAAFEGADAMGKSLSRHCHVISLQIHPPEDTAPELGHSIDVIVLLDGRML